MKQELLAMRALQETYFLDTKKLGLLNGATDTEISKRINILKYGFDARTRQALIEWSRHLIDIIGPEEWERLGYQFAKNEASNQPQLGLIARDFFVWLKAKSLSDQVYSAVCRDEAFYQSQNRKFDEPNLLTTTQSLIDSKLTLQCTTILLESQSLIVSRDRENFYMHRLNPSLFPAVKKISKDCCFLDEALTEKIEQDELVSFLMAAIQKKWFKKRLEI